LDISGPTKIVVSIEILGKDNTSVLHNFPVYVLPRHRSAFSAGTGIGKP
jgi:hypothetical protein